jgi:hypothetical protein
MKKIVIAALLLCISYTGASAQNAAGASFANLDKQVQRQNGGWAGWKQPLAVLFNAERKRLGERFYPELLRYMEQNVEKHYWVSEFLTDPEYLHGNRPLPELALFLKHRGLSLLRGREGEDNLVNALRLCVTAAVLSEQLGLRPLATAYKNEAERLLAQSPALQAKSFELGKEGRRLYDAIKAGNRTSEPAVFTVLGP